MIRKSMIVMITASLIIVGAFGTEDKELADNHQDNRNNSISAVADDTGESDAIDNSADESVMADNKNYGNDTDSSDKPSKKETEVKKTESKTKTDTSKQKDRTEESKHEHVWEPVYETITVEDYGNELHEYCKGCGADITSWSNSTWIAHSNKHLENGEQSGFYEKEIKVVTATHQIQKRVGYRCSCGAEK